MKNDIFHIAIDGPVASGKGTIARGLSQRLGIPCLDTGALYRSVAVYLRDENFDANCEKTVQQALQAIKMDVEIKNGETFVKVNGKCVTAKLRDPDVSATASIIATYTPVREFLTNIQQSIAKTEKFILEGRDISAVVLPDAKYKFFLTAKTKVRAQRRQADLAAKGIQITLREMIKQVKSRDTRDMKKGGLERVKSAIVIDNSKLTVEQTIDKFISHICGYEPN
jgi:cytidylate kinase